MLKLCNCTKLLLDKNYCLIDIIQIDNIEYQVYIDKNTRNTYIAYIDDNKELIIRQCGSYTNTYYTFILSEAEQHLKWLSEHWLEIHHILPQIKNNE